MLINVCENQNQLRQRVRAIWSQPFSLEHAIVVKTCDRYETAQSFRLFASELGARFVVLDINGSLTTEQSELLSRKGPRVVLMTGLETLPKADRETLPATLNAGGRALPVIIWLQEAANDDQSGNGNGAGQVVTAV